MFNTIKIYCYTWFIEHDVQRDYIVQTDDSFYSIDYCKDIDHPDLSKYDVLLSTSSLDRLEIFILRLFMNKYRIYSDDLLLHYLACFFKIYSSKLVDDIEKEIGFSNDIFC